MDTFGVHPLDRHRRMKDEPTNRRRELGNEQLLCGRVVAQAHCRDVGWLDRPWTQHPCEAGPDCVTDVSAKCGREVVGAFAICDELDLELAEPGGWAGIAPHDHRVLVQFGQHAA